MVPKTQSIPIAIFDVEITAPVGLIADIPCDRDKFGFHYERFWGDPPRFCLVQRSGIVIMLNQFATPGSARPNRLADPNGEAWDAYVWVDNADALCAEFKAKGVTEPAMIRVRISAAW